MDQSLICLRFVAFESERYVLREVFLKFCEIADRSGAGLAPCLPENLHLEGLNARNIRGQGYGGCSVVSGCYKRVQGVVRAVLPHALSFHCASHCLNLALVLPSEIATIIRKVSNSFCSSTV